MRVVLLSASLAMGLAACTSSEPEAPPVQAESSTAAVLPAPAVASEPGPAAIAPTGDVPASAPAMATSHAIYHYQCSDNSVHVTFDGYQAATVVVNGLSMSLPLVSSDSGMRYADGTGNEFFSKGNSDAELRLKGEGLVMCSGQAEETAAAPTRREFPLARENCLDAVAKEAKRDRATLKVIEVLWAQAGVGVTIAVPGVDAPWSCLASEDGRVDGVAYMGPEGAP